MISNFGQAQPIDPQQLKLLNDVLSQLNHEQKIWLSGYLAGQISLSLGSKETTSSASPLASPESNLTVLYGSQTGNGRSLAEGYYKHAQSLGINTKLVSLADFKPRLITKEHNIVLIISTHGEGDAPDDAEIFYDFLFAKKAPQLTHLKFSVLALGDSSYEKFCQTGIDFDQQLEKLGATRITDRVDCDLDFTDQAQSWQQQTLDYYTANILLNEHQQSNIVPISSALSNNANEYNRNHPFAAEVLTSQKITTSESTKNVYHIELSLEGSELSYQPGDSLGVFVNNRRQDVEALLELLHLDFNQDVVFDEQKMQLGELLITTLEISLLTKKFLTYYAKTYKLDDLLISLNDHQKYKNLLKTNQLIDVFKSFSAPISAQELVNNLPKITPRLYSIASSLQANPDEVHLTIALVSANDGRHGLVSGVINHEIETGDTLQIFIEANHHFKLPEDPDTPVIMIGPGTGIAPFRGFLQERETSAHPGENWLFFGNPQFDHDFLYQLEWQKLIKRGILNRLDLAFSRDQTEKIYVQHRILEHSESVWEWLSKGAHIYVCGDQNQMAKDVEIALLEVIQNHGKFDAIEAQLYLKNLKRNKRYQKDVY